MGGRNRGELPKAGDDGRDKKSGLINSGFLSDSAGDFPALKWNK